MLLSSTALFAHGLGTGFSYVQMKSMTGILILTGSDWPCALEWPVASRTRLIDIRYIYIYIYM